MTHADASIRFREGDTVVRDGTVFEIVAIDDDEIQIAHPTSKMDTIVETDKFRDRFFGGAQHIAIYR